MSPSNTAQDEAAVSPAARLANTLTRRHWTSFLLELSLIVLGILIALYIDAWLQDRADRQAELTHLELLNRDLDQMTESLQAYLSFEISNAEAGLSVLQILSSEDLEARADELRAKISNMGSRRTLRLVSAAYTDLISTGNLKLIRSGALRALLLRYFAEVARVELIVEKNNTVFVDQLFFPFLLDMRIAWAPNDWQQLDRDLDQAAIDFLKLVGTDLAVDRNDLFAAPLGAEAKGAIRRMTVMRTRVATIGQVIARSLIERTAELKAAVEDELASR